MSYRTHLDNYRHALERAIEHKADRRLARFHVNAAEAFKRRATRAALESGEYKECFAEIFRIIRECKQTEMSA